MLRATICSVNLIVMVTGVFITLLGLWLLLTDSYTPYSSSSSSPISPSTISLAVLVTGMLTVTVSFLACCGSMVSSSCLLGTFLTLIITIIVGEVALGVALYTEVQVHSRHTRNVSFV